MNKRKAMQLVRALRSGNYLQGTGALNSEGKHCCLGVACEIASAKPLKIENDDQAMIEGKWRPCTAFAGYRIDLPETVRNEFGFWTADGARNDGESIRIAGQDFKNLAEANDEGISFKRIATYIEKNYKYL
jgi:hypothetical protein